MAAAMTAAITIGLTMYAFTTRRDYTYLGGFLWTLVLSLICMSFFIWVFNIYFLHVLYCVFGVIIYSFYLIYDTQLIMGGKRYGLDMDDYIIAAIIIYLDIIMIFLYILSLFGGRK